MSLKLWWLIATTASLGIEAHNIAWLVEAVQKLGG